MEYRHVYYVEKNRKWPCFFYSYVKLPEGIAD